MVVDTNELHTLSQLIQNLDTLTSRLEKSYNDNDSETFLKIKKELLDTQLKIAGIIK